MASSLQKPTIFRSFRLEKSTMWNQGDPRGWSINVYQISDDATLSENDIHGEQENHNDGSSKRNRNEELIYGTSMAYWYKQRLFLPPSFDFGRYDEKVAHHGSLKQSYGRRQSSGLLWPLLKIKYNGVQGAVGMNATIEQAEVPARGSSNPKLDHGRNWKIHREGIRRYNMQNVDNAKTRTQTDNVAGAFKLEWRGTQRALNLLPQSSLDDKSHHSNGNLKLVAIPLRGNSSEASPVTKFSNDSDQQELILAVYSNQTAWFTLGILTIFEIAHELGILGVEEIVSSCVCIVASERLTLRGWCGGATKTTSGLPKQSSSTLNEDVDVAEP